MTLSCVPTVKRLIKHLYLPQIQNMWAPFFIRLSVTMCRVHTGVSSDANEGSVPLSLKLLFLCTLAHWIH